MVDGIPVFATVASAPLETKVKRCLRAAQIVASAWQVLASLLLFVAMDSKYRDRLRPFGIGALMISAGIYSLLLPMYYILRERPSVD